jgi:hypothetical protein
MTTETLAQPLNTCVHAHTKQEPAQPPHWGQLICTDCGQHVRYVADLATIALRRQCSIRIEKLLAIEPTLEPWESNFIGGLSSNRNGKLIPRQRLVLDEIYSNHFGDEEGGRQ